MGVLTETGRHAVLDQIEGLGWYYVPFEADTSVLTFGGAGSADETIVIGAKTYTLKASPSSADEIDIGSDAVETAGNLVAAINGASGEGTKYGTGTVANADVIAVAGDGAAVIVFMRDPTASGLAVSETSAVASWSVATMAGDGEVSSDTDEGRQAVNATLGAASAGALANDAAITWTASAALNATHVLLNDAASAGNTVGWAMLSVRQVLAAADDTFELAIGAFTLTGSDPA